MMFIHIHFYYVCVIGIKYISLSFKELIKTLNWNRAENWGKKAISDEKKKTGIDFLVPELNIN